MTTYIDNLLTCPFKQHVKPVACLPFEANAAPYYTMYHSVKQVNHEKWDSILPAEHIFLNYNYLAGLEYSLPNIDFRYVMLHKGDQLVGIALFMLFYIDGDRNNINLSSSITINQETPPLQKVQHLTANFVLNKINKLSFRTLVCGNIFATGNYGFFHTDDIKTPEALQLLQQAIEQISKEEAEKKQPISTFLIKEFSTKSLDKLGHFKEMAFKLTLAQPNMVLYIRPSWQSFTDYIQSMSSKYRTRVKRYQKKGKDIFAKELSLEEIKAHKTTLHQLYSNIADKAAINLAYISPDYFVQVKEQLQEQFQIIAYYLGNELVGFISLFTTDSYMDANFIGYQPQYNRSHALYSNILYDVVERGIAQQVKDISFGRTASEIKSTLGAVPIPMIGFMKHTNPVVNRLLVPIVNYFRDDEWIQRKPFKEIQKNKQTN